MSKDHSPLNCRYEKNASYARRIWFDFDRDSSRWRIIRYTFGNDVVDETSVKRYSHRKCKWSPLYNFLCPSSSRRSIMKIPDCVRMYIYSIQKTLLNLIDMELENDGIIVYSFVRFGYCRSTRNYYDYFSFLFVEVILQFYYSFSSNVLTSSSSQLLHYFSSSLHHDIQYYYRNETSMTAKHNVNV